MKDKKEIHCKEGKWVSFGLLLTLSVGQLIQLQPPKIYLILSLITRSFGC
jgi:hypothetical protein